MQEYITKTRKLLQKKPKLVYLLVIFSYLFFLVYYMGPSVYHCRTTIYGFGDSTAGPIWKFGLQPTQPPLGGFETTSNYPYGETLYNPINFSTGLQSTALWGLSKVAGPICGYNLFNAIGVMSTALLMFAFVAYLVKNKWIAWLAGYAVGFTPYVQSKIGGHPSYGYGVLLIALMWLSLHVLKHQRKKDALLLAVVMAACWYFDPYFILLSLTVVAPIGIVWVGQRLFGRKDDETRSLFKKQVAILALIGIVLAVLIIPLFFVRFHYSNQINQFTASTRGNVRVAAQKCSNLPQNYILPDPTNLPLTKVIGGNYTEKIINTKHWCGFGESRVSISLTLLSVVIFGGAILLWERLNKRPIGLQKGLVYAPNTFLLSVVGVAILAFILSLPPKVGKLSTPTDIVLRLTDIWRIFAREYLTLNIAVVLLAAVILATFAKLLKDHKMLKRSLFVLGLVAIFLEYQISMPFHPPTFSYTRDVPSVYFQLRDDPNTRVIAEYPLDRLGSESNAPVYYLTMQTVHHKQIFNEALPNNPGENVHIALKDLSDPQTLPALRRLGIKTLVVHGISPEELLSKVPAGSLKVLGRNNPPVYSLQATKETKTNDVLLVEIEPGPSTEQILTFKKGFTINLPIMKSPAEAEFELLQDAELAVTPLFLGSKNLTEVPVCFELKQAAIGDKDTLQILVNGKPYQTRELIDTYSVISLSAGQNDVITLHTTLGHNLRINNLGCGVK